MTRVDHKGDSWDTDNKQTNKKYIWGSGWQIYRYVHFVNIHQIVYLDFLYFFCIMLYCNLKVYLNIGLYGYVKKKMGRC